VKVTQSQDDANACIDGSAVSLAIIAAGLSAHVRSAQTSGLECTQLSNWPDDGSSLALGLKASAFNKIDPSQAESACRSALNYVQH
jgi:hypothetical protein